jgi:adenylate cyclase
MFGLVMEQNIAILIADLSGYTALTETHGAASAADLVDKYKDIVTISLVGDSHVHQYTGDEVVIVSASADWLISTAVLLMQNISEQDNFLQVHGGLHFGKILKRNNNYFGTTINLTSRIGNKAEAGTLLLSADYLNALTNPASFTFEPKGKHSFKNLNDECELYELKITTQRRLHIDPVCRMLINDTEKAIAHPHEELFFCSNECLDNYSANRNCK